MMKNNPDRGSMDTGSPAQQLAVNASVLYGEKGPENGGGTVGSLSPRARVH